MLTSTYPVEIGAFAEDSLLQLAEQFDAATFDWTRTKAIGLLNHCGKGPRSSQPTCGKILAWCKERVTAFRLSMGIRVCVFKLGITSNPVLRYLDYRSKGYSSMWLIHQSSSSDLVSMLEAALVSEYGKQVGCRNKENSGGEGCLERRPPPYFMYVCGARADQFRRIE